MASATAAWENGHDQEMEVVQPGALESMERAQIDMQIATAKKWPRSLQQVKAKMLEFATLDQETAEGCFYTLKRQDADGGEKIIQGPSVRLAEIAVSCYKNIRAGARIVDNDGKRIVSQGVCFDLENNVCISMEINRSIVTRKGKTFGQDMQTVVSNAANAISFRNAVFKVIPGALIKPVYEAAKDRAVGKGIPIATRWQKAVSTFAGLGVKDKQLLTWLKKNDPRELTDEDILHLLGLYNSLKDGETTVEEAFTFEQGSSEAAKAAADEKVRQAEAQNQPKTEAAQQQAENGDIPNDAQDPTEQGSMFAGQEQPQGNGRGFGRKRS